MNRTPPDHVIALIDYSEDRLTCSCGEQMSPAQGRDWIAHRSSLGLPPKSIGHHTLRSAGRTGAWSLGRRA